MKEIISSGFVVLREMQPHRNRGREVTFLQKGDLEWMVEERERVRRFRRTQARAAPSS